MKLSPTPRRVHCHRICAPASSNGPGTVIPAFSRPAFSFTTSTTKGYTVSDLSECFGVPEARIQNWNRRGLLGKARCARFTAESVARFARTHLPKYDLRRVNREWFKAALFGAVRLASAAPHCTCLKREKGHRKDTHG
jgi:hypothetical protein